MAGDWIKMRQSLLADPRVIRIMSALDADRYRVIGGLFAVWCLADQQTTDGRLPGYTPAILDELLQFAGLSRAMESVGWLDISDEGVQITGFDQHNSKSAKRRCQENVRKVSARQADRQRINERKDAPQEKKREDKNKTYKKRGTVAQSPPRVEEVAEYVNERSSPVNAQDFVDFYNANGWKQKGGNPIRDWRAALRTWERNGINRKTVGITVAEVPL